MRIGVMSSSRIVAEFLKHVGEMPFVEVTAMCVRPQSVEKARAMLAEAGLSGARLFTDEAEFLAWDGYDFVYNGTANHLHYEQAKRALLANRNVILEKPFTVRLDEAKELFSMAEERGLWLFEAITTPYVPGFAFLHSVLEDIGPIRAVIANFSKYSTRYDDYLARKWNTTFDPACRGGALMDMNVYNLHAVVGLLGAPEQAMYFPTAGYNGVDTGGVAVLRYPGFTASLTACKDSTAPCSIVIQGEHGFAEARAMANSLDVTRAVVDGKALEGPAPERFRMTYEFEEFDRAWRENDRDAYRAAAWQTLRVMVLLETLLKYVPAYADMAD